jgi:peptidoglycan/xylan/chitin deacetylase (PgdA/CDA1 family)
MHGRSYRLNSPLKNNNNYNRLIESSLRIIRRKDGMGIRSRLRIRTRLRSVVYRIRPPDPKPLILAYHRIADDPINHWGLAVSPGHFEEHLCVLRRTRQPLPLTQFVRNLMAGTLPRDAVALTFDDGYVDNLVAGRPRLVAADIPATVFLVTGYLNSEAFWWDELARLILLENGPQSFEVVVRGETLQFDFATEPPAREDGTTRGSLRRRRAALGTLWQALRLLEEEERQLIMVKLRLIFGGVDYRASLGRAMTSDEVRTITSDGLVSIGAHTVTHPVLAGLGSAACHRESAESKSACEDLIGAPVTAFAYPYGEFDVEAREAVKAAGFAFGCGTQPGPAKATCDIFVLPRNFVPDLGGDAFERTLRAASASS